MSKFLFENFHEDRFWKICDELSIPVEATKNIKKLSDGNRMKLMLALVFARDTEFLILDEPASPLDPLMRDKLCDMLRGYLEDGDGRKSVFFSTHNISDMENVTDYAIIMEHGNIVEAGFVEELKEKYILVKGEAADAEAAGKVLYSISKSSYGFEGICLAENLDKLAGMDIARETPTLYQISVAVMKANTKLKLPRGARFVFFRPLPHCHVWHTSCRACCPVCYCHAFYGGGYEVHADFDAVSGDIGGDRGGYLDVRRDSGKGCR